jgi:formylglycine-generating enzyme required for sulfatase activity
VTLRIWRVVGGLPKISIELDKNPSSFKGDDLPVESVTWLEVKEFMARLNRKLGLTEVNGYRLPSEAEWEYAARAGTTTPFTFGEMIDSKIVNYNGNQPYGNGERSVYRSRTVAVGSLGLANGWGLYDVHGNVWEWCEDDAHKNYSGAPVNGRAWVDVGRAASRVIRGGGWYNNAVNCRSAYRIRFTPGYRYDDLGFRLSRTLPLALLPSGRD